jgi:hypothetical protein
MIDENNDSSLSNQNTFKKPDLMQKTINILLALEEIERGPIKKTLNFVLLNVCITNFITSSLLIFTPLFINSLNNNKSDNERKSLNDINVEVCLIIGITLFVFGICYIINLFYISVKIDKQLYIKILSSLLLIVEFVLVLELNNKTYFICLFFIAIILSYLFEDTSIYLYTKIVPVDYLNCIVSPITVILYSKCFGMFVGNFVSVFAFLNKKDSNNQNSNLSALLWFQILLICISFVYLVVCSGNFKEVPIRRILRNKKPKLRRTEF